MTAPKLSQPPDSRQPNGATKPPTRTAQLAPQTKPDQPDQPDNPTKPAPPAKPATQPTETLPATNVHFLPPDLSIFDYIDTESRNRAKKCGVLSDMAVNRVFKLLNLPLPDKVSAQEALKIAHVAELMYRLEREQQPADGGDLDHARIKDITAEIQAEMGKMGKVRKGKKSQPPREQ